MAKHFLGAKIEAVRDKRSVGDDEISFYKRSQKTKNLFAIDSHTDSNGYNGGLGHRIRDKLDDYNFFSK